MGLGSNLDEPALQLERAIRALSASKGVELVAQSYFYSNPPMGPPGQPDFVNAAVELRTSLGPHALLSTLLALEQQLGRTRDGLVRWGPRVIDLDLLLYDQAQLRDDKLQLPHPGIAQRAFVLLPLSDLLPPDFNIPGMGRLAQLLNGVTVNQLKRLDYN